MQYLIDRLKNGETVSFRPHGNSMTPLLKSGQKVTVAPISKDTELKKGDVVYVKVRGNVYLHLLTAIKGDQYQISNNHGHVNGWTKFENIYGILIKVEP